MSSEEKIIKLPTERQILIKWNKGQELTGLEAGRGLVMTTINRLALGKSKPFDDEAYRQIVISEIAKDSTFKYYEHSLQTCFNLMHQDAKTSKQTASNKRALRHTELMTALKLSTIQEVIDGIKFRDKPTFTEIESDTLSANVDIERLKNLQRLESKYLSSEEWGNTYNVYVHIDKCSQEMIKAHADMLYALRRIYACNMLASWFEEVYQLPQLNQLFNTNHKEWIDSFIKESKALVKECTHNGTAFVKEIKLDDVRLKNRNIKRGKDMIFEGWQDYTYILTCINELAG